MICLSVVVDVLVGVAGFLALVIVAALAAYVERVAKALERRASVEEAREARERALWGSGEQRAAGKR